MCQLRARCFQHNRKTKGAKAMTGKSKTSDAIRALKDELLECSRNGKNTIPCTKVISALVRIHEAHHAEMEELFDRVMNILQK